MRSKPDPVARLLYGVAAVAAICGFMGLGWSLRVYFAERSSPVSDEPREIPEVYYAGFPPEHWARQYAEARAAVLENLTTAPLNSSRAMRRLRMADQEIRKALTKMDPRRAGPDPQPEGTDE